MLYSTSHLAPSAEGAGSRTLCASAIDVLGRRASRSCAALVDAADDAAGAVWLLACCGFAAAASHAAGSSARQTSLESLREYPIFCSCEKEGLVDRRLGSARASARGRRIEYYRRETTRALTRDRVHKSAFSEISPQTSACEATGCNCQTNRPATRQQPPVVCTSRGYNLSHSALVAQALDPATS